MAKSPGLAKALKRGGKPRPKLLFYNQFGHACNKEGLPSSIESLSITNVVLLSTLSQSPVQSYRHGVLHRGIPPPAIQTNDVMSRVSHEPASHPASHYRLSCGPCAPGRVPDGKFLVFGTNNIIRAGKYSHADAAACTFRMIRTLKSSGIVHPAVISTAMACPNTVVTGRSSVQLSKQNMQAHWRSHYTTRFPGIAVSLPDASIVPEVYCSDNRFIMPGVRDPDQLHAACHSLATCLEECAE